MVASNGLKAWQFQRLGVAPSAGLIGTDDPYSKIFERSFAQTRVTRYPKMLMWQETVKISGRPW